MDVDNNKQPFSLKDGAKLSGDTQKNTRSAWAQARRDCKSDREALSWFGIRSIPTLVLAPARA